MKIGYARIRTWVRRSGGPLVLAVLLSGCNYHELKRTTFSAGPGEIENPSPSEDRATYTWLAQNVFGPACLRCHGRDNPPKNVDLRSRDAIVNTAGIVIGAPDASLIYSVVKGNVMPPRNPLSADQKQALYDWIAKGAQP